MLVVAERLQEPEPLAYATFGTVFSGDAGPLRTVVEGLRELPLRVVATTGPLADPADLGPQPDNVRVERFVPQAELLPRCALVASHAGSGTFLGALAHGVPQLLAPQGADQFLNAEAGDWAGVGIRLTPGELDPARVREAAERLLADGSFAARARALAREIAAMPDPDAAAAGVEALVR